MSENIKELKSQVKKATTPEGKIDAQNTLANALISTDRKQAETWCRRAEKSARKQNYLPGLAKSVELLGRLRYVTGSYEEALSFAMEAKSIYEGINDQLGLMEAILILSLVYTGIGDFTQALSWAFESMQLAESLADLKGKARAQVSMGIAYSEIGRLQDSIDVLHAALQYYRSVDDTYNEAVVLNNLGMTYYHLGVHEESLTHSLEGLKLIRQTEDSAFETTLLDTVCLAYRGLNDLEKALEYASECLEKSQEMELSQQQVWSLLNIGQIYFEQKNEASLKFLNQAQEIAAQINAKKELYQSHEVIASVYEARGDADKALYHFKQYHLIRESVFNEESDKRLRIIEIQHQKAIAQKETEFYQEKSLELEKKVEERRQVEAELARQAHELQTVAEVSTAVASTLDQQRLMQDVVELTRQRFDLYNVHIFLLDESGQTLTLSAAAGHMGQQIVREGFPINISAEKSLIARAARTRQGVMVNDVRKDPGFLPHPLLPDTASEMAVPMIAGDQLLGVLDVLAIEVNRFMDQDVQIQTTLASQTAVAIQNARSYEQTQNALVELAQSQQSIKERETLLRTIIDSIPDWIYVKDREHRYRMVNKAYADSYNMNPETFLSKTDLELGVQEEIVQGDPEKGIRGLLADDLEVISSGEMKIIENSPIFVDGNQRFISTTKAPLKDVDGQVTAVVGFVHDVTDRIHAEEQLQTEQKRIRAILESINMPVVIATLKDGKIVYLNQPMSALLEIDRELAIGRIAPDFYSDPSDRRNYIDALKEKGEVGNFEISLKRASGEDFWALLSGRLITIDDEQAVITSILDISERQMVQQELARRATEMETVAQVGAAAATIRETDKLLQVVVNLTKEQFNLYHAHIYLMNSQKNALILTAGAGDVGRQMVAEKRVIPLQQTQSLVAEAAREKIGVVENDVQLNPAFLPHLLLPDTHSEMAVPIIVGDEVIGVLDIQSEKVNHFSEQDVTVITTLAIQIGIALDNARSFEQAETAVAKLNEITRRLTREGWQEYLSERHDDRIGFVFNAGEQHIEKLNSMITQNGSTASKNGVADNENQLSLMQPIKVHGESIGDLTVFPANSDEDVDPEMMEIINVITERLGMRINNLRLAEQTQIALSQTEEQARRMSMLNEMSAALNQADSLEKIYQIAAAETPNIMPAVRVSLALLNEAGSCFQIVAAWGLEAGMPIGTELPMADSPLTTALQENRIVHGRAGDNIESAVFVPLSAAGRNIGVLNIGNQHANAYASRDENLLWQIAALVGSSIENMRFLMREQDRAQREQMLREITQRIRNSADVETIMKTAVTEIGRTLGRQSYIRLDEQSNESGDNLKSE
jgi:PAS domain S-box-containing protein